MNIEDLDLYNLPMLLSSSKNKSYRESVMRHGVVLMNFLKDNDLIKISPFCDDGSLKEDLVVKVKDVTEDGLKLFKKAVNDWWNYLDREGKVENISHLEKGLKRIREGAEK